MPYPDLRKGRLPLAHHVYFITTVTHHRQPWFRDWRIGRLVCMVMRELQRDELVESHAWVIMPDHLHWMFSLSAETALPDVMKHLKGKSAQCINRCLGRQGPVWQQAYFDRALRRDEDIKEIARYIVANPLRAGLVERIGDYPLWDAAWL